MRPLSEIEARLKALVEEGSRASGGAAQAAEELLRLSEEILEHWVSARGEEPTRKTREGFRLLALHRQGAKAEPSFNAARETCRELAYRYNLVALDPGHAEAERRVRLAAMVATHLFLFVTGKMEAERLGEFCCSSRSLRTGEGRAE